MWDFNPAEPHVCCTCRYRANTTAWLGVIAPGEMDVYDLAAMALGTTPTQTQDPTRNTIILAESGATPGDSSPEGGAARGEAGYPVHGGSVSILDGSEQFVFGTSETIKIRKVQKHTNQMQALHVETLLTGRPLFTHQSVNGYTQRYWRAVVASKEELPALLGVLSGCWLLLRGC